MKKDNALCIKVILSFTQSRALLIQMKRTELNTTYWIRQFITNVENLEYSLSKHIDSIREFCRYSIILFLTKLTYVYVATDR